MGQAIGDVLPLAVAVAVVPVPIIAVVLLVGSERGRANGLAFLVAWAVRPAAVGRSCSCSAARPPGARGMGRPPG
jgi:hypothetical protein